MVSQAKPNINHHILDTFTGLPSCPLQRRPPKIKPQRFGSCASFACWKRRPWVFVFEWQRGLTEWQSTFMYKT